MTVYVKKYNAPPFNRAEILRYAGCKGTTPEIEALLDECLKECAEVFSYNVCYTEVPVKTDGKTLDLSFLKTSSTALMKNLENCRSAVVFGATVGIGIDRLIARYGKISPAKAVMFQAIGAERIEALCDTAEDDIQGFTAPRFSPGYGDFPLEFQKDFFKLLDPMRKIGLSLNESLLMSPTKSVTAIAGISDRPCRHEKKCSACNNTDCTFRKDK